jgi:hypothetical protein
LWRTAGKTALAEVNYEAQASQKGGPTPSRLRDLAAGIIAANDEVEDD